MGLSSNSPVVLTVVTSGQSFARSFSVKVGDVFVFVFSFICKLALALGQARAHYVLEKTRREILLEDNSDAQAMTDSRVLVSRRGGTCLH